MGIAPYLCVLLACLTGVRSNIVLTQPESAVKKPGESHRLSCTVSGFDINSNRMHWVKQVSGKGLEWLLSYHKGYNTYYAPGIQGRITFSTESSTTYIEIPNLRVEDTAMYYCARDQLGSIPDHWGSGTFLTVTSVTQSVPSVYISSPSCGTSSSQDEISLLCLVKDFQPESISQTWSSDNRVISTGIKNYPAVLGKNMNYTMSSVLKVSASDWNSNKVYHCKAGYKPDEMVERQIKKPKSQAPNLIPLVPSPEVVYNQTTAVLGCVISGFSPDSVQVSWKKDRVDQSGVVLHSKQRSDSTFETVSYLTVSVVEWTKGDVYTCEVSHAGSRFNDRISMRYRDEMSLFIRKPSIEEVWINKTATLVCTVVCSDPSQVQISWNVSRKKRSEGVTTQRPTEEGTQYIIISQLRTSAEEWDSGVEFVCSAQSSSSPSPVSKRAKNVKAKPKSPMVRLLPPPETKNESMATLECVITGFYPDLIHVSWEKDGAPITSDTRAGLTALEQGGAFSVTHYLTVSTEEWRKGSSFTCTVSHPSSNYKTSKEVKNIEEIFVYIRNPSTEEVWINKTATLECAVVCSDPSQVQISWNVSGKKRSEGVTTQRQKEEGTQHVVISQLRTSAEEWNSGVEFVCSAQSASSSSPVSKRAKNVKVLTKPKSPMVRLLSPLAQETRNESTATLECVITGFYPDLIHVTWKKDGTLISSNTRAGLTTLEQAGTFSVSHYLTVSTEEWRKGSVFTCTVSHPPSNFNSSKEVKNVQDECLDTGISVTLSKPLFEEIWRNRTATILCEVLHGDLEGVRVTWQVDGSEREDGVKTQGPERIGDKDVIFSRLMVPATEWESGVEYLCLVEDKSLPTPEKRSIRKAQVDVQTHPQVYLLPPSPHEMETDQTATLVCLVTGFSPAEIYLGWMANDTLLKSGFVNQPVTEDGRSGSNSGSQLTVSAEEWNSGTTYSCVVGHESVTTSLFRSINKSDNKPTLVNVSLVLTDSFKSCS